MQSEKTLSHFLKNPAEAQSLRGFAVFRCCLRPKAPTWKAPCGPIFTLHSPKLMDLREVSLQVWSHKNQQLTVSRKVPFFLMPRLGELNNKNNSSRLGAGRCWLGGCLSRLNRSVCHNRCKQKIYQVGNSFNFFAKWKWSCTSEEKPLFHISFQCVTQLLINAKLTDVWIAITQAAML